MSDAFESTSIFRRFKATPSPPDPLADKREAQIAFDEVLTPLGIRAPAPNPRESDADYLARLGEHAAVFGPEERKSVNRYALPSAALAQFVAEDLEIAKAEVERPHHTLKEGVLTERHRVDRSGRPFIEFYSASGPSVWMDSFKPPVMKYVSGGSQGITTPDTPQSPTHDFRKSRTVPELVELQRLAAYRDSAEYKLSEMYKAAGKTPPDELMKSLLKGAQHG
jgi:hypothetical protein